MTKKQIIERLKMDLGIDIEYITFAIWENKGLVNYFHWGEWVGRKIKVYTEEDYQKIKGRVIDLIKQRKIHPKGWKKLNKI
jgi:hypothetical protein